MYACSYMCVLVFVCLGVPVCLHFRVHLCKFACVVCLWVCVFASLCVCSVYLLVCVYLFVCLCVCMPERACVCLVGSVFVR